jgi:hypothetical protein
MNNSPIRVGDMFKCTYSTKGTNIYIKDYVYKVVDLISDYITLHCVSNNEKLLPIKPGYGFFDCYFIKVVDDEEML